MDAAGFQSVDGSKPSGEAPTSLPPLSGVSGNFFSKALEKDHLAGE